MGLLPGRVVFVLEIGARTGFISKLLAGRCSAVTRAAFEDAHHRSRKNTLSEG